jgi:hypothetical protein
MNAGHHHELSDRAELASFADHDLLLTCQIGSLDVGHALP